ncbi:MAG: bifunctional (p)ppGpp synthetase/guanosine-3',5'-bis(diphosphate) 3'-pyrophosphohydrolase [Clostridia bacterium]|nr:bifunctional (p)ppGpp synthetase/guanosine-3',5'-bis(diphosphate) 3'-pyrophosphohydrolase [Clostridia bacterium]
MDELTRKFIECYGQEQAQLAERAIAFASDAHKDQKRESGEPYIIHPKAVAATLMNMGMDSATVLAGLLHDVVEDGKNVTVEDIEAEFGADIAFLVDGVTKLTKSGKQTYITKKQEQTENLRKLFLAIAEDVRVVIIKLADRLHNMRTLEYCNTVKQQRKAKETLDVYAPLAHRFGMGAIKSELEDLAFQYLMPEEYENTRMLVSRQQTERMALLETAMDTMKSILANEGIEASVSGRPKHLLSVYRKMARQNTGINEIYDLIAIRVIVNSVNDCYAALGIIHATWKPLPGRFKDYIAMPKPNMYRSLHTTLLNSSGIPFEVQIRTMEMHRTAEYGIAAHWMYKEGRLQQNFLDKKTNWLRQVLEAKETTEDSKEFVDNILKDFLGEYVFVLTPKGEIIDLPRGSTPLDFAYRIHTNIGHHCQHARVNGSMARLDYKLQTNDVVEIITSNAQVGPSRDWMNIVKTQSAKNKIRQWFKRANRDENIQKGKEMLEEAAKRHGQSLQELSKPEYWNEVLKRHNFLSMEDMYSAIGYGGVSSGQVLHKLMDMHRKEQKLEQMQARLAEGDLREGKPTRHSPSPNTIIVHGDSGMAVRFGNCCNPLPGDPIVGYITRGRGVSVHRADCANIRNLSSDEDRMIAVEWSNQKSSFSVSLRLKLIDQTGALFEVSKVLTALNINITDMSSKATGEGYAVIDMTFMIEDADRLKAVVANLKKLKAVESVFRISR